VLVRPSGWSAWASVITDGSGRATALVPAGDAAVRLEPPGSVAVSISVEAGETTTVELAIPLEPVVDLPFDLTGADGVAYWLGREASVTGADESCAPLCVGPGYASVDWEFGFGFDYRSTGSRLSGREVMHGPNGESMPVTLSRRAFVPPSGRFVRVIDVLENSTDRVIPYELYVPAEVRSADGQAPWAATESSSGDAVFDQADEWGAYAASGEPEVALVTSGAGGAHPTVEAWDEGTPYPGWSFRYAGTVPPRQKRLVLRFFVIRPGGGANALAAALANLTDPEALIGLTPDDRAAIANFVAPVN
jgi:hypothetical protein